MAYQLFILPKAVKELAKIPKTNRQKIDKKIQNLKIEPFPPGAKSLSGKKNVYRVRSGNYRILYQVSGKRLMILVIKVGDRKDIYKSLDQLPELDTIIQKILKEL